MHQPSSKSLLAEHLAQRLAADDALLKPRLLGEVLAVLDSQVSSTPRAAFRSSAAAMPVYPKPQTPSRQNSNPTPPALTPKPQRVVPSGPSTPSPRSPTCPP